MLTGPVKCQKKTSCVSTGRTGGSVHSLGSAPYFLPVWTAWRHCIFFVLCMCIQTLLKIWSKLCKILCEDLLFLQILFISSDSIYISWPLQAMANLHSKCTRCHDADLWYMITWYCWYWSLFVWHLNRSHNLPPPLMRHDKKGKEDSLSTGFIWRPTTCSLDKNWLREVLQNWSSVYWLDFSTNYQSVFFWTDLNACIT